MAWTGVRTAAHRALGLATLVVTATAASAGPPAIATVAEPATDLVPTEPAATPADPRVLVYHRWPSVPGGAQLSLQDQIADRITLLGNELGRHLDLLSHDTFQLSVDGRRRRARIRLGGGNDQLAVRFDGDIQFDRANARIDAHIDLGFRGHSLRLELPDFEMAPAEYRGAYGIELRLPLFVQPF